MPRYYVKDPSGIPLKWGDLPNHLRTSDHVDEVATWSKKVTAKAIRNYMGGGKQESVLAGFTVSKSS